ncbi:MAG: ferric reductase [Rhodospirillales bacterium 70-18]|nr:MAG: ferric reductase [Rhodospirillales bacterium 70-18]
MQPIKHVFWGLLVLLTVLWVAAEPQVFAAATFFALRAAMMQYSGVLAIGCMSVAMILALRPRWLEPRLGGLDKMYRLHKWLGIAALLIAVVHWLWAQGPRWAVGFGLLGRPARGARPAVGSQVEQFFMSLRGSAEGIGEWAFYAVVVFIVLALVQRIPYRLFYKTHRLLAVGYLLLVFHSVVLMSFAYWTTPVGIAMVVLMAWGTWAAMMALLRRVGITHQVKGRIVSLQYYPGVRVLETEIDVPSGWPGHKAGQFAFATSDTAEGAHPYTIASAWHEAAHRINFVTKELGDYTSRLRDTLRVGQEVKIEGPYGCFTFDDASPHQIWVGAGIGVTPFIARMKNLAHLRSENASQAGLQTIELFHPTTDYDEVAERKLMADAQAANVHLHFLVDARDGRLNGERIRAAVPAWREASIWFCGPVGFGDALRRDFAEQGFPVSERFHQELFAMR